MVTSRLLCKFEDRLILPTFIQVLHYAKDDPVDTTAVSEAADSTSSASDLPERPLDDIGSSDPDSVRSWTIHKIE